MPACLEHHAVRLEVAKLVGHPLSVINDTTFECPYALC